MNPPCPTDDLGYPLDSKHCPRCSARSKAMNDAMVASVYSGDPDPDRTPAHQPANDWEGL